MSRLSRVGLSGAVGALLLVLAFALYTPSATAHGCEPEYITEERQVEVGTEYEWQLQQWAIFKWVDNGNPVWSVEEPDTPGHSIFKRYVLTGNERPVYETQQVEVPNPEYDPLCGQETPTPEPTETPEPTVEPTPEVTPEVTPTPEITPEVTPEPTPELTPEPSPSVPYDHEPVIEVVEEPAAPVYDVTICFGGSAYQVTADQAVSAFGVGAAPGTCAPDRVKARSTAEVPTVEYPMPAHAGHGWLAMQEQGSPALFLFGVGLVVFILTGTALLAYRDKE